MNPWDYSFFKPPGFCLSEPFNCHSEPHRGEDSWLSCSFSKCSYFPFLSFRPIFVISTEGRNPAPGSWFWKGVKSSDFSAPAGVRNDKEKTGVRNGISTPSFRAQRGILALAVISTEGRNLVYGSLPGMPGRLGAKVLPCPSIKGMHY